MKKENVLLILFFVAMAFAIGYVISLIKETDVAIKVSKGEI
jgi:hypothetical protein